MNTLDRFTSFGATRKGGILTLLVGILATLIWVQLQAGAFSSPGGGSYSKLSVHPGTGVQLRASLSQSKIVQGTDGTVYLDLSILTPEARRRLGVRAATDLIIVLDRSGSMGEDNKWPYATRAVHSLLDRLSGRDRVALITFDSHARVQSPLVSATEAAILRFRSLVDQLGPGASTNMGDALLKAESLVAGSRHSERQRRVILLSDGHANAGIVDPAQLAAITRRLAEQGSVVSTIGMGLGFNETLMASLADHGMGAFSYLEHLESLGTILARELADSRDLYADASEIFIELPAGVQLVDAAGYPFTLEGSRAVIRTGQLFQDGEKRFMATLRVDSQVPARYPVGTIELSYRASGETYRQQVGASQLEIVCLPFERKEEALASIDQDLYKDAWIKNNVGAFMKEIGDYVRAGRREAAEEALQLFRQRVADADAAVPGVKKEADEQLAELEARVDDAFRGPDQKTKQNRAAKALLGESQKLQREVNKNKSRK